MIPSEDDKMKTLDIPQFQFEELESALKGIANLRGADEDGIVVEMIKHSSISFKDSLLYSFNQVLSEGSFDESWHAIILQMLPK